MGPDRAPDPLVRARPRSTVSDRSPCLKCGRLLHTGEGRVLLAFTLDELETIATTVPDTHIIARALCALGLLDSEREQQLRRLGVR